MAIAQSANVTTESLELDDRQHAFWKFAFPVLSLISVSVGLAACSDWLDAGAEARGLAIRMYLLLLMCLYGAFVSNHDQFAKRFVTLMVGVAVTGAMYVSPAPPWLPGSASLLFYAMMVAWTVGTDYEPEQRASWRTDSTTPRVPPWIFHAWTVTGAVLFAGHLTPFAHPHPQVPEWVIPNRWQSFVYTHLVDLRVATTLVAGTFLVGAAVSRAMRLGRPHVPAVPRVRLDGLKLPRIAALLVGPLLRAVVVAWTIVRLPLDMVWKVVAHAAIMLGQVLREFVWLVFQHVLRPDKLIFNGLWIAMWLILLGLVRGTGVLSATLLEYLRASGNIEPPGALPYLAAAFGVGVAGVPVLVLLAFGVNQDESAKELVGRAEMCGAVYLLVFAVSGMILFVLAHMVPALELAGFERIGPVAASVLSLAALMLLVLIAWEAWKRRRALSGV